jgi:hypothetical protein
VEGIVAANELTSPASDRAREELWVALEGSPPAAEDEAA